MNNLVVLGAFAIVCSVPSRAQSNCSPVDSACREQFVRENLPEIATVDSSAENDESGSPSPYAEIAALLKEANALDGKVALARRVLFTADQGYDVPPHTADDLRRFLNHEKPRDHDALAAAERDFVAVQVKQHGLYNEAIAKTISLYNLVPKITNQHGGAALPGGEAIQDWAPLFMEQQHYDFKLHQWVIGKHADARGLTSPDGRVRILPRGMESPDILAQSIFHETSHWLERNIRGQPFSKLENWNSDVLAYSVVLENSDKLGIPEGSETQRRLEWYRERYRYQFTHPEREGHDGSEWLEYDGDISLADDAALAQESGRADPINAVVSKTIAERRAAAEVRRSDFALRDSLVEIARKACGSPDDLTQDELDALPAASGPDFLAVANPADLDKCAQDMLFRLETITAGGQRLTLEGVRRMLAPPRAAPVVAAPQPIRAVTPEMAQFVAVPQVILLACGNPGALTTQLFDYYLPRHVVDIPNLAEECRKGQSDGNRCVRRVWAKLCSYGSAISINREYVLGLAAPEQQPVAPSPGFGSAPDNSPPEKERPDRSSGKVCGPAENGGPRWCTN